MTHIASTRPRFDQWPGLDGVPAGARTRVSAAVARRLFRSAVRRLHVTVEIAGEGRPLGLGGPRMVVHRPQEFYARLGRDQLIGFGEAYLTGAWDAEDLASLLTVLAADLPTLVPAPLQRLRAVVVARPPAWMRSTSTNARDNIAHHYDLSNDLFRTFLDPSMSYSAALFDTPLVHRGDHLQAGMPSAHDDLHTAQLRKIDRLLDQTGVGEGTRVLEIGTGWGELAIRAAARGAVVHTITLSSEQQALARERIAAAGVGDRVTVELKDYRSLLGADHPDGRAYDAVLSVEMIEAVGHDFWPTYFRTLDRVLAPGGRVGIQAITMPHDRMLATRDTYTWIHKYIFPGGFLPSVRAIEEVTRAHTGLRVVDRLSFGSHYAETLRRWGDAFAAAADQVAELGFDDTFRRMWRFYLDYSRGGFASGYLDVQQLTLARTEAR